MLKKTITYEDYLGNTRTEDFYFNLSKSELSKMQMSVDGGLNKKLEQIINAGDSKEIYNNFVEIVDAAYGELSPDGKFHIKEDENGYPLYKRFKQSPAYDALMDEICQSAETVAEFCNGIIPKSVKDSGPQDHKAPATVHPV